MLDFYQQHLMLEINMVMNLKKKLLCKKNYFKPRVIYPTTLFREREQDFCLKKKKLKHLHLQTCILQEKYSQEFPRKQTKRRRKNQRNDYVRVKRSSGEPKEINKAKKTFKNNPFDLNTLRKFSIEGNKLVRQNLFLSL